VVSEREGKNIMTDDQVNFLGKIISNEMSGLRIHLSVVGGMAIFAWIMLHGGLVCAVFGGLGFVYTTAIFVRNLY